MSLRESPVSYAAAVKVSSCASVRHMGIQLCSTKNCDEHAVVSKRRPDSHTYKHYCNAHLK